ncbi:MAG TPA: serine/threonine protein kinase [Nanoarchaeota archaeon]|nr:serine/threonine protein kinase [Nanoarchaeota archaeon]HIH62886.1 serine/threonine protein kinase [Nanoarchaeota archaeon]HIJ10303.1 serine/threonine protein kinase [Nanoarchaeota archaeon]
MKKQLLLRWYQLQKFWNKEDPKLRKNLLRKLVKEEELSLKEAQMLGGANKANLNLPFKYIIRGDQFLGHKDYSDVAKNVSPICSITQNLVAKLGNSDSRLVTPNKKTALTNEYNDHCPVYEESYNLNANITKPYGIFNVYDLTQKQFRPAFVLEKINGKSLVQLTEKGLKQKSDLYNRLEKQSRKELRKLTQRFIPVDFEDRNIIVEESTGKVYIIDFEYWKRKSESKSNKPSDYFSYTKDNMKLNSYNLQGGLN